MPRDAHLLHAWPPRLRRRPALAFVLVLLALATPPAIGAPPAPAAPSAPASERSFAPTAAQAEAARQLANRLERVHYLGLAVDDALSERLFDRYLQFLDPARAFLLAGDVAGFEGWRTGLDDALRKGDLAPAFDIFNIVHQRQLARLADVVATLEDVDAAGLPSGPEHTLEVDRTDAPWAADEAELDLFWDKRIASQLIDLELAGRSRDEAAGILLERYRDQLRRAQQTKGEDVFLLFTNALTSSYDPHTQYLVPRLAENFDMQMSLSLEGIGALLRPQGEYALVERLIPAGPAEKGGDLQAGDRIVAVGQDSEGELVDVVGWRLDDVVALIRGPRGTVVRLGVLPSDAPQGSPPRTITITRDEVKLEEQSAQKEIVELQHEGRAWRLGIIDLPAFYMDMEAAQAGRKNFKSSTRDVERLLGELKAEGVDGVVLDLRGNGGGSLVEAHELSGLLLGRKPVVQVRDAEGQVQVLRGAGEPAWTGPLVVLVDRLSASASEIVAAAVQDHGRGVVAGERTFGKGTVQSVLPAADGRLLVTIAKFYRVTGESTQHAGVTPDIAFPPTHDFDNVGESALDDALEWDRIGSLPLRHKTDALSALLPALRVQHETRAVADPDFIRLAREVDLLAEVRDVKEVSLDLDTRRERQQSYETRRKQIVAEWRAAKGLPSEDTGDESTGDETAEAKATDPLDREPGESGTAKADGPRGAGAAAGAGEAGSSLGGSTASADADPAGDLTPGALGDDLAAELEEANAGLVSDTLPAGAASASDNPATRPDAWRQEALRILADLVELSGGATAQR